MTENNTHLTIGKSAEQIACQFLTEKGLKPLITNYRCYHGEIDIILKDKDDIVFVEVRARGRRDYGSALESITKHKIKKITRAATHFLQIKKWLYKVSSRFDIVTLQANHNTEIKSNNLNQWQIEWIKNAFWQEGF